MSSTWTRGGTPRSRTRHPTARTASARRAPVTIYRLVAKGTIEEQIVDLHHRKRDLADRLLEGADASARLDPDALLALLRQPPGQL